MTNHVQLPVYRPQTEADQEIRRLEQDNGWLRYRVERLKAGLSNAARELDEALRRAKQAEAELAKRLLEEAS